MVLELFILIGIVGAIGIAFFSIMGTWALIHGAGILACVWSGHGSGVKFDNGGEGVEADVPCTRSLTKRQWNNPKPIGSCPERRISLTSNKWPGACDWWL